MIKRIVPIALMGAAILSLNACKSGGDFKKLEGGLEYKIVKDAPGDKKPKMGEILEMHIVFKADDTTLINSRKENGGQPVQIMMQPSPVKGDWISGLSNLTVGDSAIFRIPVDSLKKSMPGGQQLPPFLEKRKMVIYEVVLVGIKTKEDIEKEQAAKAQGQMDIDEKMIQDYMAKNNIQANKTASGLYYKIESEGSGESPKAGQRVTVNYTGKTIDGVTFDSNTDPKFKHVEPFTFILGQQQVIRGWDEGVALLKKGSKAKLLIPSPLAYGPNGNGPIPANGVLVFDIEVKNIDEAPKEQQMPQMQVQ
jgi:FKBP-type peptidyl-prolyl cis-trans isomerase FkpA